MILSDRDIKARLLQGDLVIKPLKDPDVQIQSTSVDLRLGKQLLVVNIERLIEAHKAQELPPGPNNPIGLVSHAFHPLSILDCRDLDSLKGYTVPREISDEGYLLTPTEFALGMTEEWIEIPNDLVCRMEGRSSLGRLGLFAHITAGFVDAGFKGNLTLELLNVNRYYLRLYTGMRICQVTFLKMTSPAEVPYGDKRKSKYHNRTEPVASLIAKDAEAAK